MWAIGVGCVSGIALVIAMVMSKGLDGGRDAGSWAWIDVVSQSSSRGHCLRLPILYGPENGWLTRCTSGLRSRLRQADRHGSKIHPPSLGELQTTVNYWLEHQSDSARSSWRRLINRAARDRFKSAKRLVRNNGEPGQAGIGQRIYNIRRYIHGAALYTVQRDQGRGRWDGLGKARIDCAAGRGGYCEMTDTHRLYFDSELFSEIIQ